MRRPVRSMVVGFFGLAYLLSLGAGRDRAEAVPALQLFIEGATYDSATDTWVLSTGGPFQLWVIADVAKTGGIEGVKLSAAVSTSEIPGGSITLAPTTTTLLTDPSTPGDPSTTSNFPSADGVVPVRGDGTPLPAHGIYGAGTSFFEWNLGDFTLTDSPVGDFVDAFPTTFPTTGQINVYTVAVTGFTRVHFDAYNHVFDATNHGDYKFAPFSHDAETRVPEPGTLVLVTTGLGLGGVIAGLRRSSTRRASKPTGPRPC